jgi:pimeloyl-ACP methyl ester carboxylesterase
VEVPRGNPPDLLRKNAEGAGNDLLALLPFLQIGGWPGGLRSIRPVNMPSLVIVAEDDEYMAATDALLTRLDPTPILQLYGKGHHQVMRDDEVKQSALAFLRSAVR